MRNFIKPEINILKFNCGNVICTSNSLRVDGEDEEDSRQVQMRETFFDE